ncbi:MAG: hypothetical protein AB1810_04820 [Pseudomonadota bacterium]
MEQFKESGITRGLSFPLLVWVCGMIMWPAAQVSARDIYFLAPTEAQCRACHEDLRTFPQLEIRNPDRHHRRVNWPIVGLANGFHSTMAPGDTSAGIYTCLTCHELVPNATTEFGFKPFRDCLGCHVIPSVLTSPGSGQNVHHFTNTFREGRCRECHESPLAQKNKRLADACKDSKYCYYYDNDSDYLIEDFNGDFSGAGGSYPYNR